MPIADFVEDRMPEQISYGALGGPKFKTTILPLSSGYEQRNIDWSKFRGEWDVSYGLKTQAEVDVLHAFFITKYGQAVGFRFKDWKDYHQPRQVIGQTDGSKAAFQIFKTYTAGPVTYDRIIKKPVAGTVMVWLAGVQLIAPAGFTVDTTTGIITLSNTNKATTGLSVEAYCEYDAPVRFGTDHMATAIEDYNVFTWGQIPVVEIKLK